MGQEHSDLRRTRASLFYLIAYLFPLAVGLLISPTDTFHLLGSHAKHATTAWRLFGGLLLVLANRGGTLDTKTSINRIHQYRHRPTGIRGPLQLPAREDWKPGVPGCPHHARVRGGLDSHRPRPRPSRVDRRAPESHRRSDCLNESIDDGQGVCRG